MLSWLVGCWVGVLATVKDAMVTLTLQGGPTGDVRSCSTGK